MNDGDREAGFITLHRQVLSSAIWQNINDWRLAETLLLLANFKPSEFLSQNGEIVKVGRGELVRKVESLEKASGLSRQNIRTSLKHLKNAQFLTMKVTKTFHQIKITNYDKFQSQENLANHQSNHRLTIAQPGNNNVEQRNKTTTPLHEGAKGLVELLLSLLAGNGVRRLPEEQKALTDADKLLRIDARPVAEARAVLAWAQADPFWKSNILSIGAFRKQYDRLKLKMDSESAKGIPNGHIQPPAVNVAQMRSNTAAILASRRQETIQ